MPGHFWVRKVQPLVSNAKPQHIGSVSKEAKRCVSRPYRAGAHLFICTRGDNVHEV